MIRLVSGRGYFSTDPNPNTLHRFPLLLVLVCFSCSDSDRRLAFGPSVGDILFFSAINASGGSGDSGTNGGSITMSAGGNLSLSRLGSVSAPPLLLGLGATILRNVGVNASQLEGTTHAGIHLEQGAVIFLDKNDVILRSSGDVVLEGNIETRRTPNGLLGFHAFNNLTIEVTGNVWVAGTIDLSGLDTGGNAGAFTIRAQGSILVTGSIRTRGGDSPFVGRGGNGASITLDAQSGGTLGVSGVLDGRGGSGFDDPAGTPGNITLAAASDLTLASFERISAMGGFSEGTATTGGSLSLSAGGDLTIEGMELYATGGIREASGVAGAGGTITLSAVSRLRLENGIIDASGGEGNQDGGSGGTITLTQNAALGNPARLNGVLSVRGGNGRAQSGGAGGAIAVTAAAGIENRGLLTAEGELPNGQGGTITLDGGTAVAAGIWNYGTVLATPNGTNRAIGNIRVQGVVSPPFTP